MQRWSELDEQDAAAGADPGEVRLGGLLRGVGPLPRSELAARRVRRSVQQRMASPPARPPRWRPALAAALLLLVGGVAGATIGRSAWDRLRPAAAPAPAPTDHRGAPLTGAAGPARSPSNAEAAPANPPSPVAIPAAHPPARPPLRPRLESARPGPAAAVDDGDLDAPTALINAALSALRKDADPERARLLCDDYLRQNPDGPVAEDALALSIEAAAAQQDPEAAAIARRYLARYPTGRYRAAADAALARFPAPATSPPRR